MIRADGLYFKDEHGRTVMLRGVNLGGSSKLPVHPDGATHLRERFYDHRAVSFVGRPFPPAEATEHFARLRQWGFNCIRFVITWEAIEHSGPGIYDLIYLDYLRKMIEKAGEFGFYVFIDPHQDAWSRWTGGDGAPGWTLEAVGFELAHLHETGAAFLHQEHGDPMPPMQWISNHVKLGAATMFTLFFGGNDFAPHTTIDGRPVQEYLQTHFIEAFKQVAQRVRDMPHVIGYEAFNEPSPGWIGHPDLHYRSEKMLHIGPSPTPFQAMQLGSGVMQTVDVFKLGPAGTRITHQETLNSNKRRVWRQGYEAVWQANGVWDFVPGSDHQQVMLLRPRHFSQRDGQPVDFNRDYLVPFIERFTKEIRSVHPGTIMFVEGTREYGLPPLKIEAAVNATHWYDSLTLFLRRWLPNISVDSQTNRPIIGAAAIDRQFATELHEIKRDGLEKLGGPTLIGEFGIAYDLNDKIGYRDHDFSMHTAAVDRTWRALEANLLSGTIWTYTADNNNEHGDLWNGEDLSIFSRDQIGPLDDSHELDAGGRATAALVRPYPRVTAGRPLKLSFDLTSRTFTYTFEHDPAIGLDHPTEIFVPDYHYSVGFAVEVSDGRCEVDPETQTLVYYHTMDQRQHTIKITRDHGEAEVLQGEIPTEEGDFLLEHKFVHTNGLNLHTVQAGPADGEPVILLHGFPEFWYGWREQIPFLVRQGYRVIAPDQRGYNLSDKPSKIADYQLDKLAADIVGLIDALGYEQVYLIGHDWGAAVTWWLAAKYPSRIKKSITLNVPHMWVMQEQLMTNPKQLQRSWYMGFFQLPMVPESLARSNNWRFAEQMMLRSSHPDTFTEQDMAQYRKAWSRPQAIKSMINWYRALARHPLNLADPIVRKPMLLIWGAQDTALGRELARPSVEQYCLNGEVVFIEEATHWVQHDEPERVNKLIARFLSADS